MRIKMLNDCPGSRDGLKVENFKKDMEYDVPESLAKCFLDSKVAIESGQISKTDLKNNDSKPSTISQKG